MGCIVDLTHIHALQGVEMSTRKTADERRRERLGDVIRQHRELQALSHGEAAKRADISRRNWIDVEAGRTKRPIPGTRRGIERALGWSRGSFEDVLNGGEPTFVELRTADERYQENVRMIISMLGQASPDAVQQMAETLHSDLVAPPERTTREV